VSKQEVILNERENVTAKKINVGVILPSGDRGQIDRTLWIGLIRARVFEGSNWASSVLFKVDIVASPTINSLVTKSFET
jgi:hypothetical protein